MRIGVVVRTKRLWSMTRFEDEQAILHFIHRVPEVIQDVLDINIVALSMDLVKEPEEGFEASYMNHIYWCPYCGEPRKFYILDYPGSRQCEICHISDHDFYVRKFNNLFKRLR